VQGNITVSFEGMCAAQAPREIPSEVQGKQQLLSETGHVVIITSDGKKPCLGKAGSRVRRNNSPKWYNSGS